MHKQVVSWPAAAGVATMSVAAAGLMAVAVYPQDVPDTPLPAASSEKSLERSKERLRSQSVGAITKHLGRASKALITETYEWNGDRIFRMPLADGRVAYVAPDRRVQVLDKDLDEEFRFGQDGTFVGFPVATRRDANQSSILVEDAGKVAIFCVDSSGSHGQAIVRTRQEVSNPAIARRVLAETWQQCQVPTSEASRSTGSIGVSLNF